MQDTVRFRRHTEVVDPSSVIQVIFYHQRGPRHGVITRNGVWSVRLQQYGRRRMMMLCPGWWARLHGHPKQAGAITATGEEGPAGPSASPISKETCKMVDDNPHATVGLDTKRRSHSRVRKAKKTRGAPTTKQSRQAAYRTLYGGSLSEG